MLTNFFLRILQQWVDYATEGRRKAAIAGDQLLVDAFKLCVNSLFGKFIESILNQHSTFLIGDEEHCVNSLGSPFLKDFVFLQDGSVLCQHYRERVTMNRPTILGVSILELSKCLTYDYFYSVLKKSFGDRIQLLYTDTDSFVLRIFTNSLENELKVIESTLDTSNYPTASPLFSMTHAKQLFKWKNECASSPILLFLALRPKCYAILTEESLKDLIERQNQGVCPSNLPKALRNQELRNKGVIRTLCADMGIVPFLVSLLAKSFISANFMKIELCGSIPHFVRITKSCLSFLDNKSMQKECFIHSLPYGSKSSLECDCME